MKPGDRVRLLVSSRFTINDGLKVGDIYTIKYHYSKIVESVLIQESLVGFIHLANRFELVTKSGSFQNLYNKLNER